MKHIDLTIYLFCILFAVSCNKSSDQKTVLVDSTLKSENNGTYNSSNINNQNVLSEVNDRINTDYNTAVISLNIPGSPIDPNKLKSFIPDKIPGADRSPINTGSMMGDNDNICTSTSCNYTFIKGGLVINIQDYGKYSNLPADDKKYFTKMPIESGYVNESVVTTEGKGFILWDEKIRSGRMFFLLANRFVIKLEAYTLPANAGDIIFYFNMINQKAMLRTASGN